MVINEKSGIMRYMHASVYGENFKALLPTILLHDLTV
jgi:hypothetical protein